MNLDAILLEILPLTFTTLLVFIFAVFGYVIAIFIPWYIVIGLLSAIYWLSVMEHTPSPDEIKKRKDIFVVIIGAGYSGLCTAIKLKRERIRFVLIEKSRNVGGTWWENQYPGCACDIMSHLYSLSFQPNPFWSTSFPSQPEILSYLEDTADYYGIREHIQFGTKVEKCRFNEKEGKWNVETSDGNIIQCNFLVSGVGALHVPKFPNITGRDKFQGDKLHTAKWQKEFDWTGKKVGIIGTGCSAVQVVPSIATQCKELFVFQRTPAWITPRFDFKYPKFLQNCFHLLPFIMKIHRWYIFVRQEFLFELVFTKGRQTTKTLRKLLAWIMQKQLNDEDLKKKLLPDYEVGCKRITISNKYLPAFNKENVHLVTKPIKEVTSKGIKVYDGESSSEIELDAIIYATGFDVTNSFSGVDIETPKDGKLLQEVWGDNPNAYLGIMQPECPNLFFCLGPMTGLGHNSAVWMIEQQIEYIMKAITQTISQNCLTIEVSAQANKEFQSYVRETSKDRVYTSGGCVSWYQNSQGFTYALWPSNCIMYWWKTLSLNLNHFIFSKNAE